jgi:hypothetical protein
MKMSKVRYGFVSNSSSSSFMLPVTSEDKTITITLSIDDLENMFDDNDYDSSSIRKVLQTKEDVDAYMIEEYGTSYKEDMEDNPYLEDEYRQAISMVESGKTVLVGRIMYGDSFLENLVKKMGGKIES